jgi:dihydroorotate dehydrogenase (NAD+) catalytic subunit
MTASGTFGYGLEFEDVVDLTAIGGIIVKGTTFQPRQGNDYPRMAETPSGMLNCVGLQNKGVQYFCEEIYPKIRNIDTEMIVNVSGSSPEDYARCAACINELEDIHAIELNISCPNVHNGGMAFGTSPEAAAEVTAAVKAVTTKPVYMKLSPNVTDIVAIAKACEAAGADGLCLINTVLGMRIDIRRRKPVIANRYGGYSGSGIFPLALRMVNQVARATNLPIIGCGGVSSAEDVIEMMMAGATAVEIGAANLTNPMVAKQIVNRLPALMEELKIEKLTDIIGIVNHE